MTEIKECNKENTDIGIERTPWVVVITYDEYRDVEFEFSSMIGACDFIETANAHSLKKLKFKLYAKEDSSAKESETK